MTDDTVSNKLTHSLDLLLPFSECLMARKPYELRAWVLAKCDQFSKLPELRKPILLREGRFKWFHEEVYPLSLFAVPRYPNRDDVLCVPKYNPAYDIDAEVHEPSRHIRLEITGAHEPTAHLRMLYFVEHGRVSFTGAITADGTKTTGRQITNELEFIPHEQSRAAHLKWIKVAAEGKAGQGRYGNGYELLISVEDWWYDVEDAISSMVRCLRYHSRSTRCI
jgi:hypothetical protein